MNALFAGTIVSWVPPKQDTRLVDLWNAMKSSGIDEEIAKECSPRVAFNRAIKEMSESRIIRRINDGDSETIRFQFTKEYLQSGELKYEKETVVELDPENGVVSCIDPSIQARAQNLLDGHREVKDPSDITRIIQKVFEKSGGDLIPVRQQGGCYFVPFTHTGLLEKVGRLLDLIQGKLCQWEVTAQSDSTSQTVADSVSTHLFALLDELDHKCESINEKTNEKVLARRLEELVAIRVKLEAYNSLLGDFNVVIASALDESQKRICERATAQSAA